jgi:phage FluMu protein Com
MEKTEKPRTPAEVVVDNIRRWATSYVSNTCPRNKTAEFAEQLNEVVAFVRGSGKGTASVLSELVRTWGESHLEHTCPANEKKRCEYLVEEAVKFIENVETGLKPICTEKKEKDSK